LERIVLTFLTRHAVKSKLVVRFE